MTPKPPTTAEGLLDQLRLAGLASRVQLRVWASTWTGRSPDAILSDLLRRGLVTPFQAQQLAAGRGRQLRLGAYRLLEPLGSGGTSRVYRAEHRYLHRVVAIKVMQKGFQGSHEWGQQELEFTTRLHHPHVISLLDAGVARGRFYLVLEHIDGLDLQRWVQQFGPLPLPAAREVLRQVVSALQAFHEAGLAHGDVKPANLLLEGESVRSETSFRALRVLLIDLGLTGPAGVTVQPGIVQGTPDYLAPERWCGEPADTRSDLYSLGCTLYFLLTGKVPHPSESQHAKMIGHGTETPVALRQLCPEIPQDLETVVTRLMAREPHERYPTPAALLNELQGSQGSQGIQPEIQPRRRRLPGPVPCVSAILVGLIVGGALPRLPRAEPNVHNAQPTSFVVTQQDTELKRTPESTIRTWVDWTEVLAKAPDGATVIVPAGARLRCSAVSLQGRALTLRATPGERPQLEMVADPARPWQPLFLCDRSLTLIGLDIIRTSEESAIIEAHGASVRLHNCRLADTGFSGAPLILLRGSRELRIEGGSLHATGPAVLVEPGPECRIRLSRTRIEVRRYDGPALLVWQRPFAASATSVLASEGTSKRASKDKDAVHIFFEEVELEAGRAVACQGQRSIRVEQTACRFRLRCAEWMTELSAQEGTE